MQTGCWIGGQSTPASQTFDVVDPATGEVLAAVSDGTPQMAAEAVAVADRAQQAWAAEAPRTRSEILRACFETLIAHTEELADLITAESGKPLADARGEVAYAAEFFRWNAEEAVRILGTIGTSPNGANTMIVRHPPIGVVAMVTPWNLPVAMITRKVAPALAAGNATVIKPPPDTPLSPLRTVELLEQAGVPAGLINIIPTTDAAGVFDAMVDARPTRMVSFTGSTSTGRVLLRRAADRVLRTAMELGGNAPFVVFADADLDAAVAGAMVAKMRHSSETCTAANRFYVEAPVAAEFSERLAAAMSAIKVGNGRVEGVEMGPLINQAAVDKVSSLVDGAVAEGASVVMGADRPDSPGFFYNPTVLADVSADAAITRTEIFGPVAPVIPFTDIDEMVNAANDTEAGLMSYVFTEDLRKGLSVAERMQSGMVGLNKGVASDPAAPFGGMKQSGLGREGAHEGVLEFCETQYIATSW